MSDKAMDRRKKNLVDSEIQLGFARRVVFHWVAFFLVGSTVGIALQVLSDPFRPFSEQVKLLCFTNGPFLLAMIFMLPVFVADTIKFSLRLAGPIFRLRQSIRDLACGKTVEPLKTRKNDYWNTTVEEFNSLIWRVQQADGAAEEPVLKVSDSQAARA